jgi:hypothetical protein
MAGGVSLFFLASRIALYVELGTASASSLTLSAIFAGGGHMLGTLAVFGPSLLPAEFFGAEPASLCILVPFLSGI